MKNFLLQVLSSNRLHDKNCQLYVLYQFILKRPQINAGIELLPDLVDFYLWVHEEFNNKIYFKMAQDNSVETFLSTYLNRYSLELRDQRLKQFHKIKCEFNAVRMS